MANIWWCRPNNGTKQWGPYAVQEVVAAKAYYGARQALVITTSHFTPAAFTLARDNGVVLWDPKSLLQLQQERAVIDASRTPLRVMLERFLRGIT